MKVTPAEEERLEILGIGLNLFGITEGDLSIILMMVCNHPDRVEALIQWLATHEGATTAEISNAVVEIAQTVK